MTVRDKNGRFAKKAAPRPFKVGDVVRMSAAGKRKWRYAYANSHDAIGTVIGFHNDGDGLDVQVKWNGGCTNAYRVIDLEAVPSAPKQMKNPEAKKVFIVQPEAEPAFVALAKALGYNVQKVK
jgi:hypothetical protein